MCLIPLEQLMCCMASLCAVCPPHSSANFHFCPAFAPTSVAIHSSAQNPNAVEHAQVKLWEVQESDEANQVGSAEASMDYVVRENQRRMSTARIHIPADAELESIISNPDMLRLVGMTRVSYGQGREMTCRQS
jgi:hypothetical protein